MRIHHVARAIKGWLDATDGNRQEGVCVAHAVKHLGWRLWHSQVQRALGLTGDTLAALDTIATMVSPTRMAASKVSGLLCGLETYVLGQAALIIDYAAARHGAKPVSTAPTESAVRWLPHRRMGANQQMLWSPRGTRMMLKVRTTVANGTFPRDYAAAERCARRPFCQVA